MFLFRVGTLDRLWVAVRRWISSRSGRMTICTRKLKRRLKRFVPLINSRRHKSANITNLIDVISRQIRLARRNSAKPRKRKRKEYGNQKGSKQPHSKNAYVGNL